MINAARRQQLSSSSERKRVYQKNKLFKRIEADIKERDKRRIPGKIFSCRMESLAAIGTAFHYLHNLHLWDVSKLSALLVVQGAMLKFLQF